MKKYSVLFICAISLFSSCHTEGGVKLTADDRYRIDTLSNRQVTFLTSDLDKWCKDSTPIFRQHFVDSLVLVREQDILKQTSTIVH
jgi:hypothetical protein